MQVSATLIKSNKYFDYFKGSKYLIISCSVLILGLLCGALVVSFLGNGASEALKLIFIEIFKFESKSSFLKIFLNSLIEGMIFLLLICLSSFGVCGYPIIPSILFFKGLFLNVISGFLYRNYSLQGIAFSNLILLPKNLFDCFILIYISSEGLKLCSKFFLIIKDVSARGIEIRPDFIKMLRTTLVAVFLMILSSVLDAFFSVCFIKYFNFS